MDRKCVHRLFTGICRGIFAICIIMLSATMCTKFITGAFPITLHERTYYLIGLVISGYLGWDIQERSDEQRINQHDA